MMAAPPTPPSVSPKRTEFIRALSSMLGARQGAFADDVCRAFIVYYDRIMDTPSLVKRVLSEVKHGVVGSVILLRRWIEMRASADIRDLREHSKQRGKTSSSSLLRSVIRGIQDAAKKYKPLIDEINLTKLALLRAFHGRSPKSAALASPAPTLRSLAADASTKFFGSDPALIANAMAHAGSKSFAAVPLFELGVRPAELSIRAPHLAADIKRSNRISYWVASNVLFQTNPKAQERAIQHFVKIAFFSVQIGDLASSTAIMNGFTLNVVGRLFRHLWHVSSAVCSMAAAAQRIASAENDFGAMRKELEVRRTVNKPILPFLAYYSKKLEFADTGNPWVLASTGDINTAKLEIIGRVLGEIEAMQKVALKDYSPPGGTRFPPYIVQMVDRMPSKSEDALEARTCELRPRGGVDSESVSAILFSASSSRSENSENESGSGASDRDMVELYD